MGEENLGRMGADDDAAEKIVGKEESGSQQGRGAGWQQHDCEWRHCE